MYIDTIYLQKGSFLFMKSKLNALEDMIKLMNYLKHVELNILDNSQGQREVVIFKCF